MKYSVKNMTRAAMVAALYAVLTVMFQPLSFGPVQFRVSEALTLLPVLLPEAVPGLTIGCVLANLLGGAPWYDVVFGSAATLLAAVCTRRLRGRIPLAAAMPVLFNGLIVGPVVYFAYSKAPGAPVSVPLLIKDMLSVVLGEAAVCAVAAPVLMYALSRPLRAVWK